MGYVTNEGHVWPRRSHFPGKSVTGNPNARRWYRRWTMKAKDFEKEFFAMPEKEQRKVLRKIMPVFCRNMMQDPGKVREMFSMVAEECGEPMANMVSMMGMMGRKRGGCCG